ncbi:FadR/GntR family transcriptional regulator [Nocardiopsis oceani]
MSTGPDTPNDAVDMFQPVSSTRISQTIVDQVRSLIRSGGLKVGSRLPSERELGERFGVSRITVREALRMLEANGLVEIRVGGGGGAFVTIPSSGQVSEGITDLLSMSALSSAQVTEARSVFELGIVPLVCERANDQDITELMDLCDKAAEARSQGSYTVAMSFDFHTRIAAATHNPAVVMFMRSFREPILKSLQQAHHEGQQGVEEHRAFVEAVRDRDVERAQTVLGEHLQRTANRLAF